MTEPAQKAVEYSREELDKLYAPWMGLPQTTRQISKSVFYVGHFSGFGDVFARNKLAYYERSGIPVEKRGLPIVQSREYQEKALDAALAKLKDCIVLSTTPTYYSQFQSACLLKSRGFKLLEGKCYDHPGYAHLPLKTPEHPGVPDRKLHWEHVWWKVLGEPGEIGLPTECNQLNNCGIDTGAGLEWITAHDIGDRCRYLAVAWLPRGILFPKGWKRFYSGLDYKLGANFELISQRSKVQECPHKFDLGVFKDWEPDLAKWTPS